MGRMASRNNHKEIAMTDTTATNIIADPFVGNDNGYWIEGTNGRVHQCDAAGRVLHTEHDTTLDDLVWEWEEQAAIYEGERQAEFVMSYVMGGGRPQDAMLAYRQGQAIAEGRAAWGEDDDGAVCEHGMAAWLCAGPDHYPADDPFEDAF